MMKLLNTFLGGPEGAEGRGPGSVGFRAEDLSKATGLPPFVANLFTGPGQGQGAPTPAEAKRATLWSSVHILVSVLAGAYAVYRIRTATQRFGPDPPPPPTLQNPFLLLVMGELLIEGSQLLVAPRWRGRGPGGWFQMVKNLARDGLILVFMLGMASWWTGAG